MKEKTNTDIECFDITIINNDISIYCKDKFQYATIWNRYGLQCNFDNDSDKYKQLLSLLKEVEVNFKEINIIINNK